jgi:hypothetical protein
MKFPCGIKSCKNSFEFSPNKIVILLMHSQEVNCVPVRARDHLYVVKTFEEGDSVRGLTEIDVLVDANDSLFQFVSS